VPVSDQQLTKVVTALAEAARANEETAARFVPPRTGILEEVSARRHQLVYGRRGVGKSTLLLRVAASGPEDGREVIFIDVETLRRRPYPDVLIELLQELLENVEGRLQRGRLMQRLRRRALLKRVRTLVSAMAELLAQPQSAEHTLSVLKSQTRKTARSLSGRGSLRAPVPTGTPIAVDVEASAGVSRESVSGEQSNASVEARFEKTKMDGLAEAAVLIREVLQDVSAELKTPTLLVLDDFYHVALDDQPEVLAYLHQVLKGLDYHLKVCAVKHRLKPFSDGNPPVGLQPEHDASTISLDITLERFSAARDFLERVLSGICDPLAVDIDELLTDGGRERLVLASGGVARDYLSLTSRALRNSNERPSGQFRPKNRITAEDVAQASADLYQQKQEDLRQDAGDEAERLRERLSGLVQFCLDKLSTNVFLVETTKLEEEAWGKEIQALADLRFIHRIGTLSTKRGGETYPGRKFAAFTLDLSTWTTTRSEQIRQIQFWKREGRQQVRSPAFIYTPERANGMEDAAERAAAEVDDAAVETSAAGEQMTIEWDWDETVDEECGGHNGATAPPETGQDDADPSASGTL
jgi:Cdc6-like AAA superfamily ATPase